jgi:hypothetical protein
MTHEAYRGSRVVDGRHRAVGKVSDVIYDPDGTARWAVVRLGLLRPEHYVPLESMRFTLDNELVVPYDRRTVSRSPQAERDHVLSSSVERVVEQYYRLAS